MTRRLTALRSPASTEPPVAAREPRIRPALTSAYRRAVTATQRRSRSVAGVPWLSLAGLGALVFAMFLISAVIGLCMLALALMLADFALRG